MTLRGRCVPSADGGIGVSDGIYIESPCTLRYEFASKLTQTLPVQFEPPPPFADNNSQMKKRYTLNFHFWRVKK